MYVRITFTGYWFSEAAAAAAAAVSIGGAPPPENSVCRRDDVITHPGWFYYIILHHVQTLYKNHNNTQHIYKYNLIALFCLYMYATIKLITCQSTRIQPKK